jgi:WS/DGAT/MGAT family acyltransferase
MTLLGVKWAEQATSMLQGLQSYAVPANPVPERLGELNEAFESVGSIGKPPETSLNGVIGPRRRFDWVSTTLAEAKEIRTLVPGSTVNDAMLAVIAGGLRDLLAGRGERVDELVLQVMVPVSLRAEAAKADAAGNQVTGFVAPLPVCEPDGIERLRRIHASTKELKESKQAVSIHAITQAVDFAPPALMAAAGRMAIQQGSFMNLTVTNVPGPREHLFLLGARMLELNPMVPIGNGLTVNVAVESYAGKLSIGMCADADAVPDLDVLTNGIRASIDELLQAARR